MEPLGPTYTADLFPPLHRELLALLRGLDAGDWERPTLAGRWRVHDVAAHLLDGDLRKLAVYRDGHRPPSTRPVDGYRDLVALINDLNAEGVSYARRLSPRLLVDLLAVTGPWVSELVAELPPHAEAIFAVSWAGETRSENWMDTGREYTERWHHQMQIRDAVGEPRLLEQRWLMPLLDLSLRTLPHAYAAMAAPPGTTVTFAVAGVADGVWSLVRRDRAWALCRGAPDSPDVRVEAEPDVAWRLLYNTLSPEAARERLRIEGDAALAAPLLGARSVMV